jgi:hypothetical protein
METEPGKPVIFAGHKQDKVKTQACTGQIQTAEDASFLSMLRLPENAAGS